MVPIVLPLNSPFWPLQKPGDYGGLWTAHGALVPAATALSDNISSCVCVCWDRVYIAQAGLKLMILLASASQSWYYRCEIPDLAPGGIVWLEQISIASGTPFSATDLKNEFFLISMRNSSPLLMTNSSYHYSLTPLLCGLRSKEWQAYRRPY
jgi:hypothetical protein